MPSFRESLARALPAFFLFCASVAAPAVAHADGMTVEDAIARSARTHERAKIAALSVEDAEGQVVSARADLLPTVTFGAQAVLAPDPDARYVTGNGTLTVRQPILAPSALPRLWSAEHQVKAEKLSAQEEMRVLAFDTAAAFLEVVAAERLVAAASARLTRAKANFDYSQARAEAELNSINDVTRAKLEVTTAAREVAQKKRDVETLRLTLAVLVGTDVDAIIAPTTLFADALAFRGDAAQLAQSAVAARNDVKALAEQSLAARDLAREPLFRLIPAIDLTGQIRVNPDPLMGDAWHDESLTLSLTWTIFDGGGRYGDRQSNLAKAETAEAQQSLVVRTLTAQVKSSFAVLAASRETLTIAEEANVAAHTNTEETRELYQQGLARAIELVDANAAQFDAESEVATAQVDLAKAYLNVRFALGLQPVDGVRAGAK